ncbi:MAG: tetratricopeptide repeat protein [Casimicrobiaceae bacterium]
MNTVSRNSLCPCGSGKRSKHCCQRIVTGAALTSSSAGGTPQPVQPVSPTSAMTADARYRHASSLLEQGRLQEAIDGLTTVLSLQPNFAPASFTLAQALWMQGTLEPAVERLRHGLSLMPQVAEAHNNLGLLYKTLGKYELAVESFRRALAIKPDFPWAHCNLGNALHDQREPDAAIASYLRALAIDPAHVESYCSLGNIYSEQNDLEAALTAYRKALSLRPGYALAELGLGRALQARGEVDAAIDCFRSALALAPEQLDSYSGLLFSMNIHPSITPAERLAEAIRFGRVVAARARPIERWAVDPKDRSAGRGTPLRVGLVSGDLRTHPVGFFIESILAHLDPARLELVAYSTLPHEDALTARIKPRFAAWTGISGRSDEAAAARIREDGVHILIDLSGHTAHNRLSLLAWKPAPLQATWLGYFATTGVAAIDYLLADRVSVPESLQDQFTEAIWYLPDGRFCFTPPADGAQFPMSPPPALRDGSVTFGCFQNFLKLNNAVLASWGRILRALPHARLRIQNPSMQFANTRGAFLKRLGRAGIDLDRVSLFGHAPRDDYLRAHADVDIILDTFPYTGATTTCEALWMGVPTLTVAGNTLVSRQGASLLVCSGLKEWVAADEDDFVARAIALASNVDGLARLRSGLREQVLASPLFDAARFARNLEETLVKMWQRKTDLR